MLELYIWFGVQWEFGCCIFGSQGVRMQK